MVDGGRKMEGSSYPDVVAARGFKSLYLPFSLSPSLAALCVCARARVYLCTDISVREGDGPQIYAR